MEKECETVFDGVRDLRRVDRTLNPNVQYFRKILEISKL